MLLVISALKKKTASDLEGGFSRGVRKGLFKDVTFEQTPEWSAGVSSHAKV